MELNLRKHWLITLILLSILLFFLEKTYAEKRIYMSLTRDCSVYKGRDHKEFMDCWRSQRQAGYELRKRLGHYDKPTKRKVVDGNRQGYTTNH